MHVDVFREHGGGDVPFHYDLLFGDNVISVQMHEVVFSCLSTYLRGFGGAEAAAKVEALPWEDYGDNLLQLRLSLPVHQGSEIDWGACDSVGRQLHDLFFWMLYLDTTDLNLPAAHQLFAVQMMSPRGGLSVVVMPALARWISTHQGDEYEKMILSGMYEAYGHMTGKEIEGWRCHSFRYRVWDQKFPSFVVPGECACLGADGNTRTALEDQDEAFELSGHNIDNSLQQLTMLAGLGTLVRLAREGE